MTDEQIKKEAKRQAGLMLIGNLNGWEPDNLVRKLGQDVVDLISDEMSAIANRLLKQGTRRSK